MTYLKPGYISDHCSHCGSWLEPGDEFRPPVDWVCPRCPDVTYVDMPI